MSSNSPKDEPGEAPGRPGFKLSEAVRRGDCQIRQFRSGRRLTASELEQLEHDHPLTHLKLCLVLFILAEKSRGNAGRGGNGRSLLRQFEPRELPDGEGPGTAVYEIECGSQRWLF